MRILGIDPGLSNGGFAVVEIAGPRVFHLLGVLDIPTMGDEHRKRVDVLKLAEWLGKFQIEQAVIERAQLMPSKDGSVQGVSSGGKYMRAVGAIEATVILSGAKLSTVEPSVWKRHYKLKGGKENKEQARDLAVSYFPEWADKAFARKKDHNRAEAALIARFAALHFASSGETEKAPLADAGQLALWREGEGEPNANRTAIRKRHTLLR